MAIHIYLSLRNGGSWRPSRCKITTVDAEQGVYNVVTNGETLSEVYLNAEDGLTVSKSTANGFETTANPNTNTRLSSSNLSSDSLTIANADAFTTYGISGFTVENSDVAVTLGLDADGNAFVTRTTPDDTVGTTDNLVKESDFVQSIADLTTITSVTDLNLALTNQAVNDLALVTGLHDAQLSATADAVDANTQSIVNLSDATGTLLTTTGALEAVTDANTQSIVELVGVAAAHDQKIGAIATAVDKNTQTIAKAAQFDADLTALQAQADALTYMTVDGLNAVGNKLTQLDDKMDRVAVDNTNRIQALDKKMHRAMAQQAALSGLFQPYGVGKVNVTAGFGGYGSQGAVAIGAGYRINEKK